MLTYQQELQVIKSLCHKQTKFLLTELDEILPDKVKAQFLGKLSDFEKKWLTKFIKNPVKEYHPKPNPKRKHAKSFPVTQKQPITKGFPTQSVFVK